MHTELSKTKSSDQRILTHLPLDGGGDFITLLHDAFIHRVTEACRQTLYS